MMSINPRLLTSAGDAQGNPPDDSGLWKPLIADTFSEEGARFLWSRPNPLADSSLAPSDADPPERRLLFGLRPALDPVAVHDREILMAEDYWNDGALIVIPMAVARIDIDFIHALLTSTTVGELREHPRAWNVAAELRDINDDPDDVPAAELPSSEPFDAYEWFGDEGVAYVMPLARLRTAETAPSCLESLLRPDGSSGMGYEPAPWLSTEDTDAVLATLSDHGYLPIESPEFARRYCF